MSKQNPTPQKPTTPQRDQPQRVPLREQPQPQRERKEINAPNPDKGRGQPPAKK